MSKHDNRLNVLVMAEACNPQWSSVPLIGYQMAKALSVRTDLNVTVVTHSRNERDLENTDLSRQAKIEYVNSDSVAGPLFRMGKFIRGGDGLGFMTNTAAAYPGYVWFEYLVNRRFGHDLANRRYDLIHRLTPVSPSLCGPIVQKSPVPVVIGPVNGGLAWPNGYQDLCDQEREWLAPIRNAYKLMPFNRSTFRQAAAVLTGSRQARHEVGTGKGIRRAIPENGIDPVRFPIANHWPETKNRFRFVFAGRLVPCKGVSFILDAMAGSLLLRNTELTIVGDGPFRKSLENQSARLGLTERVQFLGWVNQVELSSILSSSQAFVFPSVREFGGGAVLEAMACGLPCIVTDYGGPAELVTNQCGITIPVAQRSELISKLRQAMEKIVSDPLLCRALGKAACDRVRNEFTWDEKARQVADVYRQVISTRKS